MFGKRGEEVGAGEANLGEERLEAAFPFRFEHVEHLGQSDIATLLRAVAALGFPEREMTGEAFPAWSMGMAEPDSGMAGSVGDGFLLEKAGMDADAQRLEASACEVLTFEMRDVAATQIGAEGGVEALPKCTGLSRETGAHLEMVGVVLRCRCQLLDPQNPKTPQL